MTIVAYCKKDPNEAGKRVSVTMDSELYEQVNEFRHKYGFPTQTRAIITLILAGLDAERQPKQ